jgi:hypothetical protein
MSVTITNAESTILARVLSVGVSTLPEIVAKEMLKWEFSDFDRSRMRELAAKARLGELTSGEQEEADAYERVTSFLGLVKSQARRSIKNGADN